MPNSVSIPFSALLAGHKYKNGGSDNATYTTLLDNGDLRKAFIQLFTEGESGEVGEHMLDRILRGEQAVVASCGSGMTAAVIWLALHELGCERPVSLYDEVRYQELSFSSQVKSLAGRQSHAATPTLGSGSNKPKKS